MEQRVLKKIGLLLSIMLFVSACVNTTPKTENTNIQTSCVSEDCFVYSPISLEQSINGNKIRITYPKFVSETLNNQISQLWKPLIKQPSNTQSKKKNINKLTITGTVKIVENTADFISFLYTQTVLSDDHLPQKNINTLVYDKHNNKPLLLLDILKEHKKTLSEVAEEARNQLEKKIMFPDRHWIKEGTQPLEKNYQYFTVHKNKAFTFYFLPYQVAAYSDGMQTITIQTQKENN